MSVEQRINAGFERAEEASGGSNRFSKRTLRLTLYLQLVLIDIITLLLGIYVTSWGLQQFGFGAADMNATLAIIPIYLAIAAARGGYSLETLTSSLLSVRSASLGLGTAVFVVLTVAFFLKSGEDISRLHFAASVSTCAFFLLLGRSLFPRQVRLALNGLLVNELIIVHGKPLSIPQERATLVDAESIGLIPDLNNPVMLSYFGGIVESFDRVLIDSRPEFHRQWALLLKGANVNGEIVVEQANEIGAIAMSKFHGKDTLLVARQPLSLHNRLQKRALDLAICLPLLLALAPLLLVVALAVKLDSKGPVFFRQDRVGRGNRLFKVLKFRSMRTETCDARGMRSTSRDDDRITRVGRVIRATSIDELPQLINVLLGDMSLVGPRPHALGSQAGDKLFWQIDDTYWLRHQLKPGITGLAQVRGFRGATLKIADLTDRLQADMEYIQGWNIWRDLAILVNTARVIWHPNAY